jgi:hypothetical protein
MAELASFVSLERPDVLRTTVPRKKKLRVGALVETRGQKC